MLLSFLTALSLAGTTGGIPRHPDIGGDTIVFTAGADLWTVPREGGTARRISDHDGVERFARISPDGAWIAYTAEYDGDSDVWIVPTEGGTPTRLTWHSSGYLDDVVWDWTADSKRVLFGSTLDSPTGRHHLFTVSIDGGLPEPLPTSDTGPSALGPDGSVYFNRKFRNFRTWNRYKGGMQQDIWHFANGKSERIVDFPGTDTHPMPHADGSLLFVSDRPEVDDQLSTRNLFRRAPDGTVTQLTRHTELDVQWPALDGDTVVYMHGGDLRVLDLTSGSDTVLPLVIPDQALETRRHRKEVWPSAWSASPGPQAKRFAMVAHGDLFSLPAKDGTWRPLETGSEGRVWEAAWSPDGRNVAFISDRHGEQQVWLVAQDGSSEPVRITKTNDNWISGLTWSADSKRLLFTDKRMQLWDLEVATKALHLVDTGEVAAIGSPSYSADGSWIAYTKLDPSRLSSVWIHDVRTRANHRVTDESYDDFAPAWDPKSRYLYFASRRNVDLVTSQFEFRIVQRMTDQLYVVRLRKDADDPLAALSDEEIDPEKNEPVLEEESEEEKKQKKRKKRKKEKQVVPDAPRVRIDLDGLASRVQRLPVPPGRFSELSATADALYWLAYPALSGSPTLHRWNFGKRTQETVLSGISGYMLAAGHDKLAYLDGGGTLRVTGVGANAAPGDAVPMPSIRTWVDPKVEWRRTLDEVRRYMRDYFYDPDMHGNDWDAVHERYAALLERATVPSDVNWLVGQMLAELNAGHAYSRGGGSTVRRTPTGRLGAVLAAEDGGVRFSKVYEGEPGAPGRESPLRAPGVDVQEGEWLLAIDGQTLGPNDNPYEHLVGMVNRPVTLRVGPTRDPKASREVVVRPIRSDYGLRYGDWVQTNRERVREKTGGRVGYIHLPNTSSDGYIALVKGLTSQHHLDGLVVDVRFNGGGFIPEMFIEQLMRPHYNTWVPRDGADWRTPSIAMHGPKVCVTNGYAGSGGDAFPYYFQQFGLGKLVGETTWGGLVGINNYLPLLIGGGVNAPSFAFVNRDGEWDVERVGVTPDIEVVDPPEAWRAGDDPQLDRAIEVVLEELKDWKDPVPPRPARFPVRD